MTKTEFHKKWENYWYYYKIHTIIAVFVIIFMAVLIQQCASRADPDMTVMVVTKSVAVSQDKLDGIQNMLQKYTADVNHDGRKVVSCEVFNLNENQDPQMLNALNMKLIAEISSSNAALFITDSDEYKHLDQNGELFDKFSNVSSGSPKNDRIKLSSIEDFKNIVSKTGDKLTLSIRIYKGTTIENSKNKPYYDNSVNVVHALTQVK